MVLMTFVLMSETDGGALAFSGSGCVSWTKLSSTRGGLHWCSLALVAVSAAPSV